MKMEATAATAAAGGSNMDILRGRKTPGPQRRQSSVVRVFICSAFTDMTAERKALLDKAYPEVIALCRGLGLVFEPVDLRWGLRNVAAGDHTNAELFLREIEECRRISAVPAFVVLLGNRYGNRVLPRVVPEKMFEVFSSKLSKNAEGLKLLSQWYVKDDNSDPPAFVLQPVKSQKGSQKDTDGLTWRLTETQLLRLLRNTATDAEAGGDITAEEKQIFFKSVTECEIGNGLWKTDGQMSTMVFIRESPRQKNKDGAKRFRRIVDATGDALVDPEAQALLTALKSRIQAASQESLNQHNVELSKGSVDPTRKDHAHYLDSLCQQFVQQVTAKIGSAVESRRRKWGSTEDEKLDASEWVVEEVGRHAAAGAELCKGLQGREGLLGKLCLAVWDSISARHGPLVVHGAAGCGKTAMLCKLAQEMANVLEGGATLVVRFLSVCHPWSVSVDHVLRSVCFQICLACGLAPPTPLVANTHVELVRCFKKLLEDVSLQNNSLLIILDSLDHLSDEHHARKLHWLPLELPPNVQLVISMETNSDLFANLRMKLKSVQSFFEVDTLTREEGKQIINSCLGASQRTLTQAQSDAVLQKFEKMGSPLHLRLMLTAAKRWQSSTPSKELHLGADAQEMLMLLLQYLEEKHGKQLVGAALGYIALAREGLQESELRDLLSLDDTVIAEVYRHGLPPTPSMIRAPPLLWARLKLDLRDQLEERWVDGVNTITFNNRLVYRLVTSRYLTPEHRGRCLKILAEYFLGRWSGKLRPVALSGALMVSDRKVPPQPLWFAPGLANVRKLQELPYHMLHAGMWEELRQEVVGNAEWLYCKTRVCGLSSVIQDLDQCSKYMDCIETGLIRDALVLIKPSLDLLNGIMDMSVFYTELFARLLSLAKPFSSVIGQLCSQCEEWLLTCPEPVLIPKCSILQQPGGARLFTLRGLQGGVTCLHVSLAANLLVAGSDDGAVAIWSLSDMELIHTLQGHSGAVLSAAIILSAAQCVSLAADGSLRGWSLQTGRQLFCVVEAVPLDSTPSSAHIRLSEKTQHIIVYTMKQVKVWKMDDVQMVYCNDEDFILGVLGDCVVSLSDSGLLRIFQPANSDQAVKTQLKNLKNFTPLAFVTSPKRGKVFVALEEGLIHQISKTGNQTITEFPVVPSLLSVNEDERILLAVSERTLTVFNVDSAEGVNRIMDLVHEEDVLSACVSADCKLLASGAVDQLVRIWSVTTGLLLDTFCGMDAPVSSVALFHGVVVSASTMSTELGVWSLKYDNRHKPLAHPPADCSHIAFTKDCDKVFYIQEPSYGNVVSWNCNSGLPSERLAVSGDVSCLEVADQKRLLLCGLDTGTVLIYPLAMPQETLCIPPPESLSRVCCLALTPMGKHLAVAYEDSLRLYQITSRDTFPALEGPIATATLSLLHAPVSSMALLADRRLLYGTGCGEVKLYAFDNDESSCLESHSSRVTCVTPSNWGTHALVGSEDAVQRLWSLKPLAVEHTMEYKGIFCDGVLSAAFSESDQYLFTGSQDRTINVWDVASGNLLFVQYVYSPVIKMGTCRNGFVALTQQGRVFKEVFRCPEHISPDYNPLRHIKAQYRVTSREKTANGEHGSGSEHPLYDFNPAQLDPKVILGSKSSPTCCTM